MLRLARSRLLPRSGALAPRASCLAAVDAARFFSSQTEDGDDGEKDDKSSLFSAAAWTTAVKPAYLTFLALNKHLMVPVKFVVPSGDDAWPEAAWGYALGKHAAWLRKQWREGRQEIKPEQLKELEEMQFAWDRSQYKWDHFILPALRRFYELNRHTDVLQEFRVPKGDSKWPDRLWGQKLGVQVSSIRSQGHFAKQVRAEAEELERIKFCHDSTIYDRDWREKLIPALEVFQQEFGNCNVGLNFRVPSSSPWPRAAWKMHLGNAVSAIRCGQLGVGRDHRELDELGFVWNDSEHEWSERILPALKAYREIEDHCRVPIGFVVPSRKPWPEQAWGLRLGGSVSRIRIVNAYSAQVSRDSSQLEALEFVWDPAEADWSERILPALEVYRQLRGDCRVPIGFVVPSDDKWPEKAWGIRLGETVSRIRCANAFSAQVSRDSSQLEALGFVWDPAEADWRERIFPALEVYRQLRGDCRVPRSFVVPSDEKWPENSWGLRLGETVNSIRGAKAYSVQVSRDKRQLEKLGFVWNFFEAEWGERILPALKVYFKENGHSRVPLSFVVPSEAPWPIETHRLKLGRRLSNIRHRGDYFDYTTRSVDMLQAIGFELKIPDAKWRDRVEPLLATFEQLHGHCNVPRDFVVPSEAPWNEEVWGIQLGKLERKKSSHEA
jgi:hypothetical protein